MNRDSERASAFAEFLNRGLAALRWNRSDLAARLEVNPSTVNKWGRGERLPNPWFSRRIAEVMGLDEREVLIRAGHLDPIPLDEDPVRTELHDLIDSIPIDSLRPFVAVFQQLAPSRQDDQDEGE